MGIIHYNDLTAKTPVPPPDLLDLADFISHRFWTPDSGDQGYADWLADSGFSFSRVSSPTEVKANGIINTSASGAIRYGYDPSALPQVNPHLGSAENMTDSAWVKTNVTATADQTAAPMTETTADSVMETTTNGAHYINRLYSASAEEYVWSTYIKPNGRNIILMYATDGATTAFCSCQFDITAGTFQVVDNALSVSGGVSAAGHGWYRCWIKFTYTAVNAGNLVQLRLCNGTSLASPGATSYAGVTTKGVYVWGSQLTPATTLPDYMGENLGFLAESAMSNLALRSQEFENATWSKANASVTANPIVDPRYVATADKLVDNTTNGEHSATQTIAVTSGTQYTYSVFVRAGEYSRLRFGMQRSDFAAYAMVTFNLNTETFTTSLVSASNVQYGFFKYPNGWYRVWVTALVSAMTSCLCRHFLVNNADAVTYAGTGSSGMYLWGAQLEAGVMPTSYIATTTAAVARTLDKLTRPWTPPSEFTAVISGKTPLNVASGAFPHIWAVDDGAYDNRIIAYYNGTNGNIQVVVTTGGVTQATLQTALAFDTDFKLAIAIKENDIRASVNGAAILSDTSATLPTVNTERIGSDPTNGWNSTIKSRKLYERAMTDTELMALAA